MSPAQRLSADLCPECGHSLAGIDVMHHVVDHWGERIPDDPRFEQARVRRRMLADYARTHAKPAPER
jgi:hypothetical protein